MTFASGAFGLLRYIPEATPGTTPTTGNGFDLRMTGQSLKGTVASAKSNEIAAHRMSTGSTNVDLNVEGGVEFELSGKEYDPFIAGVACSEFAHYGTAGLGATFTATTAANAITAAVAPSGSSAFSGLAANSWFKLNPPSSASSAVKAYFADKWFKAASTTDVEITLHASTPIAGVGLGIVAQAGYTITQSVVSNGSTAKAFTLEHAQEDIGQFLWYSGMQTNTMDIKLDVGSIITGSFGFTGRGHDISSASVLPGSSTASHDLEVMNAVTDVGMVMENGANLLTSGSFIKSISLSVKNNLRAQKAIAVYGSAGVGLGELEVGGTMEVYFEDATYYRKWLSGTSTSLAIGMADQAGNGYLFEMDKVKFKDLGLGGGGKSNDVMLSLPFEAFYSAGAGRGLRITRAISA